MAKNKDQLDLSVELAERSSQMEKELTRREDEVARLKQEVVRGNKLKDKLNTKLRAAEEMKAELESKREGLKQQIGSLERGKHSSTAVEQISDTCARIFQRWRVNGDRQSWIREHLRIY